MYKFDLTIVIKDQTEELQFILIGPLAAAERVLSILIDGVEAQHGQLAGGFVAKLGVPSDGEKEPATTS